MDLAIIFLFNNQVEFSYLSLKEKLESLAAEFDKEDGKSRRLAAISLSAAGDKTIVRVYDFFTDFSQIDSVFLGQGAATYDPVVTNTLDCQQLYAIVLDKIVSSKSSGFNELFELSWQKHVQKSCLVVAVEPTERGRLSQVYDDGADDSTDAAILADQLSGSDIRLVAARPLPSETFLITLFAHTGGNIVDLDERDSIQQEFISSHPAEELLEEFVENEHYPNKRKDTEPGTEHMEIESEENSVFTRNDGDIYSLDGDGDDSLDDFDELVERNRMAEEEEPTVNVDIKDDQAEAIVIDIEEKTDRDVEPVAQLDYAAPIAAVQLDADSTTSEANDVDMDNMHASRGLDSSKVYESKLDEDNSQLLLEMQNAISDLNAEVESETDVMDNNNLLDNYHRFSAEAKEATATTPVTRDEADSLLASFDYFQPGDEIVTPHTDENLLGAFDIPNMNATSSFVTSPIPPFDATIMEYSQEEDASVHSQSPDGIQPIEINIDPLHIPPTPMSTPLGVPEPLSRSSYDLPMDEKSDMFDFLSNHLQVDLEQLQRERSSNTEQVVPEVETESVSLKDSPVESYVVDAEPTSNTAVATRISEQCNMRYSRHDSELTEADEDDEGDIVFVAEDSITLSSRSKVYSKGHDTEEEEFVPQLEEDIQESAKLKRQSSLEPAEENLPPKIAKVNVEHSEQSLDASDSSALGFLVVEENESKAYLAAERYNQPESELYDQSEENESSAENQLSATQSKEYVEPKGRSHNAALLRLISTSLDIPESDELLEEFIGIATSKGNIEDKINELATVNEEVEEEQKEVKDQGREEENVERKGDIEKGKEEEENDKEVEEEEEDKKENEQQIPLVEKTDEFSLISYDNVLTADMSLEPGSLCSMETKRIQEDNEVESQDSDDELSLQDAVDDIKRKQMQKTEITNNNDSSSSEAEIELLSESGDYVGLTCRMSASCPVYVSESDEEPYATSYKYDQLQNEENIASVVNVAEPLLDCTPQISSSYPDSVGISSSSSELNSPRTTIIEGDDVTNQGNIEDSGPPISFESEYSVDNYSLPMANKAACYSWKYLPTEDQSAKTLQVPEKEEEGSTSAYSTEDSDSEQSADLETIFDDHVMTRAATLEVDDEGLIETYETEEHSWMDLTESQAKVQEDVTTKDKVMDSTNMASITVIPDYIDNIGNELGDSVMKQMFQQIDKKEDDDEDELSESVTLSTFSKLDQSRKSILKPRSLDNDSDDDSDVTHHRLVQFTKQPNVESDDESCSDSTSQQRTVVEFSRQNIDMDDHDLVDRNAELYSSQNLSSDSDDSSSDSMIVYQHEAGHEEEFDTILEPMNLDPSELPQNVRLLQKLNLATIEEDNESVSNEKHEGHIDCNRLSTSSQSEHDESSTFQHMYKERNLSNSTLSPTLEFISSISAEGIPSAVEKTPQMGKATEAMTSLVPSEESDSESTVRVFDVGFDRTEKELDVYASTYADMTSNESRNVTEDVISPIYIPPVLPKRLRRAESDVTDLIASRPVRKELTRRRSMETPSSLELITEEEIVPDYMKNDATGNRNVINEGINSTDNYVDEIAAKISDDIYKDALTMHSELHAQQNDVSRNDPDINSNEAVIKANESRNQTEFDLKADEAQALPPENYVEEADEQHNVVNIEYAQSNTLFDQSNSVPVNQQINLSQDETSIECVCEALVEEEAIKPEKILSSMKKKDVTETKDEQAVALLAGCRSVPRSIDDDNEMVIEEEITASVIQKHSEHFTEADVSPEQSYNHPTEDREPETWDQTAVSVDIFRDAELSSENKIVELKFDKTEAVCELIENVDNTQDGHSGPCTKNNSSEDMMETHLADRADEVQSVDNSPIHQSTVVSTQLHYDQVVQDDVKDQGPADKAEVKDLDVDDSMLHNKADVTADVSYMKNLANIEEDSIIAVMDGSSKALKKKDEIDDKDADKDSWSVRSVFDLYTEKNPKANDDNFIENEINLVDEDVIAATVAEYKQPYARTDTADPERTLAIAQESNITPVLHGSQDLAIGDLSAEELEAEGLPTEPEYAINSQFAFSASELPFQESGKADVDEAYVTLHELADDEPAEAGSDLGLRADDFIPLRTHSDVTNATLVVATDVPVVLVTEAAAEDTMDELVLTAGGIQDDDTQSIHSVEAVSDDQFYNTSENSNFYVAYDKLSDDFERDNSASTSLSLISVDGEYADQMPSLNPQVLSPRLSSVSSNSEDEYVINNSQETDTALNVNGGDAALVALDTQETGNGMFAAMKNVSIDIGIDTMLLAMDTATSAPSEDALVALGTVDITQENDFSEVKGAPALYHGNDEHVPIDIGSDTMLLAMDTATLEPSEDALVALRTVDITQENDFSEVEGAPALYHDNDEHVPIDIGSDTMLLAMDTATSEPSDDALVALRTVDITQENDFSEVEGAPALYHGNDEHVPIDIGSDTMLLAMDTATSAPSEDALVALGTVDITQENDFSEVEGAPALYHGNDEHVPIDIGSDTMLLAMDTATLEPSEDALVALRTVDITQENDFSEVEGAPALYHGNDEHVPIDIGSDTMLLAMDTATSAPSENALVALGTVEITHENDFSEVEDAPVLYHGNDKNVPIDIGNDTMLLAMDTATSAPSEDALVALRTVEITQENDFSEVEGAPALYHGNDEHVPIDIGSDTMLLAMDTATSAPSKDAFVALGTVEITQENDFSEVEEAPALYHGNDKNVPIDIGSDTILLAMDTATSAPSKDALVALGTVEITHENDFSEVEDAPVLYHGNDKNVPIDIGNDTMLLAMDTATSAPSEDALVASGTVDIAQENDFSEVEDAPVLFHGNDKNVPIDIGNDTMLLAMDTATSAPSEDVLVALGTVEITQENDFSEVEEAPALYHGNDKNVPIDIGNDTMLLAMDTATSAPSEDALVALGTVEITQENDFSEVEEVPALYHGNDEHVPIDIGSDTMLLAMDTATSAPSEDALVALRTVDIVSNREFSDDEVVQPVAEVNFPEDVLNSNDANESKKIASCTEATTPSETNAMPVVSDDYIVTQFGLEEINNYQINTDKSAENFADTKAVTTINISSKTAFHGDLSTADTDMFTTNDVSTELDNVSVTMADFQHDRESPRLATRLSADTSDDALVQEANDIKTSQDDPTLIEENVQDDGIVRQPSAVWYDESTHNADQPSSINSENSRPEIILKQSGSNERPDNISKESYASSIGSSMPPDSPVSQRSVTLSLASTTAVAPIDNVSSITENSDRQKTVEDQLQQCVDEDPLLVPLRNLDDNSVCDMLPVKGSVEDDVKGVTTDDQSKQSDNIETVSEHVDPKVLSPRQRPRRPGVYTAKKRFASVLCPGSDCVIL